MISSLKINDIFFILLLLFSYLGIEIKFSDVIDSINISDFIYIIMILLCFLYIVKHKKIYKINNIFLPLLSLWILVLIFRGFYLNFITKAGIAENNLIMLYGNFIRSKGHWNNFFRISQLIPNTFSYLRYILAIFVLYSGFIISKNKNNILNIQKSSLILALIIHLLVSYNQIINLERINGLFKNPQDLGSLALLLFTIIISNYEKKGIIDKIGILIAIISIILSQTRSAIFTILFLLIINKNLKKVTYGAMISIITVTLFTLLLSTNVKFINIILNIVSLITDPYDLYLRTILWSKVFINLLYYDIIFGTNTIPSFTDNIIWWLISPLGIVGFILFYMFILKEILKQKNKNNIFVNNLIIILFVQGFLFPGFLEITLMNIWFFTFGISLGAYNNKLINENNVRIHTMKKLETSQ